MVKVIRDNETAEMILRERYLAKDENGNLIETTDQLFHRVASTIAGVDRTYGIPEEQVFVTENRFYNMMKNFDFLPNSPTLMNAGMPLGQLSACFVLPVEDTMEGIFQTIKDTAIIHKSGGGTGFNFSSLRAKDSIVQSTKGKSSGPISFMKVFDSATEAVKQGGKRRGASMAMIRVDHPDILEFITCKDDMNTLNNFNISVAVTDEFMEAVYNKTSYNIYDHHHDIVKQLDANMVFDKIVHQAWKNGEPGILFIDEVNRKNIYGTIEATNPCG